MVFNYEVCEKCCRREENKPDCQYRKMTLLNYLDYKRIPYKFVDDGAKLIIDTNNLMNSSAMIELNNEINRSNNNCIETGWDYKVVI